MSNDFEGEEKGSSSEEDDSNFAKIEAAQNAENERLRQKQARELLLEQDQNKRTLFIFYIFLIEFLYKGCFEIGFSTDLIFGMVFFIFS